MNPISEIINRPLVKVFLATDFHRFFSVILEIRDKKLLLPIQYSMYEV